MKLWFRRLFEWLASGRSDTRESPQLEVSEKAQQPIRAGRREQAYFVQVGFDFGTAFSKVVCRDVLTDRAWVYRPTHGRPDSPFLIPSQVTITDTEVARDGASGTRVTGLKMALSKIALGAVDASELTLFRSLISGGDTGALSLLVHSCAAYHIGELLAGVRADVTRRYPGFGDLADDYMAINMALPVADAERPAVNRSFLVALVAGWNLAARIAPGDPVTLLMVADEVRAASNASAGQNACYVYPEVSANVQGFVRSRTSSPGIYLFSDTGAGTVDQSVFIFNRHDGRESLTYLNAAVLGLGSSQIESRAAAAAGARDPSDVDRFRIRKEARESDQFLRIAGNQIREELEAETTRTLLRAREKLAWRDQLTQTRVIFGGGGHAAEPYEAGTLIPFQGQIFARPLRPETLGMPIPRDLEIAESDRWWMKRLSVAYGLSFVRDELTPFIYPVSVAKPTPDELWRPRRRPGHAPSKDEV